MTAPDYPNYPHAPMPPAPPSRKPKGRGLAVASLVLGIIALVFSWIPFLNILFIIIGFVGLILGVVGIFVSHRIMSVIGAVLSLIGIIVAFTVTAGTANAINKAVNAPPPTVQDQSSGTAQGQGAAADTYEYKITGSGQATINYGTLSGSGISTSSVTQGLPWSKTISVTNKGAFFAPSLTATSTSGGTISCQIVHNGKVVSNQSASGQFATVSCSGN